MFWWIDEPVLLGSHNPSDDEVAELIRKGVAAVISLLDENEQKPAYGDSHFLDGGCMRFSIPVPDFGVPTADQIGQFLLLMEMNRGRGTVLLHCQGGSGRTGTFGAAWLISRGMNGADALAAVRAANPGAVETAEQEEFVLGFLKPGPGQD